MGNVPDRGGRPNETRPPPEMPSFKKRTEPSPQEKRGMTYRTGLAWVYRNLGVFRQKVLICMCINENLNLKTLASTIELVPNLQK